MNVKKNDNIIQQKSIPVAWVKKLRRSEEHAVSSGVTASLTSGVTASLTSGVTASLTSEVSAATTAFPSAASTMPSVEFLRLHWSLHNKHCHTTWGKYNSHQWWFHTKQWKLHNVQSFTIGGGYNSHQWRFLPQHYRLPRAELGHLWPVQQSSVEVFYQKVEAPQCAKLYHLQQEKTAMSGHFLPNSGSSTTSRALPPAVSTKAISSGFSNSFTSGGLLPNSGSSTTSTAIPAATLSSPCLSKSPEHTLAQNQLICIIVPINNRIKRCAGCSFEFLDTSGPTSASDGGKRNQQILPLRKWMSIK